jgi:hypothetical protein
MCPDLNISLTSSRGYIFWLFSFIYFIYKELAIWCLERLHFLAVLFSVLFARSSPNHGVLIGEAFTST